KIKSFRITVNRIEKKLEGSNEVAREIGAFVVEKTGLKVSLNDFILLFANSSLTNFSTTSFISPMSGSHSIAGEKLAIPKTVFNALLISSSPNCLLYK
ncbi:hypothetical protein KY325_02115, partial [Candidatus Woesearchaeota archaeon]|nr:hypothetical protein [Candidatus Woesearchaeota archaeon]